MSRSKSRRKSKSNSRNSRGRSKGDSIIKSTSRCHLLSSYLRPFFYHPPILPLYLSSSFPLFLFPLFSFLNPLPLSPFLPLLLFYLHLIYSKRSSPSPFFFLFPFSSYLLILLFFLHLFHSKYSSSSLLIFLFSTLLPPPISF